MIVWISKAIAPCWSMPGGPLDSAALRECIRDALTYHQKP